ncbi:MAG: type IV pilus assembly protein PilM [Candidatus Kerfeldbacteria bacterium]|nr:type IV pilus assembly protein PilM [Candidatus Kerfeldbacteria bacterium]
MHYSSVGIDISDLVLRLVQLRGRRGRYEISAHGDIDVPSGAIHDGRIERPAEVGALLRKLLDHAHGSLSLHPGVVACLPEQQSFLKLIHLPPGAADQRRQQVLDALPQHFPVSIDEVYVDWQEVTRRQKTPGTQVLVGACLRDVVDRYVEVFETAHVELRALEIESIALARLAVPRIEERSGYPIAMLLVDIGRERSSFILYDHGMIPFTASSNAISGTIFTRTIAQKLHLREEQAEKAKRLCGMDHSCAKGAVARVLEKTIQQLLAEIHRHIAFYQDHFEESNPVRRVLLTGGGANLLMLPEYCTRELHIPVERIDVSRAALDVLRPPPATLAGALASYPTALGLALRDLRRND